jgi:hypothetical protein
MRLRRIDLGWPDLHLHVHGIQAAGCVITLGGRSSSPLGIRTPE